MAKIRSLKQYNAKYKKTKAELLQFTRKELEAEAKLRGCDVDYLLKGRKWIKVGDSYCEIPRLFSARWIKNIRTSVKILTCSLLTGGAVTAVAVPVSINIINNTIESSDGSINIKIEKNSSGDRLVRISAKDTEKRVASFTIKKGNVEFKEGTDYTVNVISIDETEIVIKKESFEKNSGRLVITPTLEIKCTITLDKTHIEMNMKDHTTDLITAKVTGYSQIVTWTSSNESVCTVNDGAVTALDNGESVITAEANGKIATCSINVYTAVDSVNFDKSSIALNLTDHTNEQITATINPTKASVKNVNFEIISGSDVIELNESSILSGSPITVTAKKNGNATIKATAGGKEAICNVNVNTKLESIVLSSTSEILDLNTKPSFELTGTVNPETATIQDIAWTVTSGNDVINIDKTSTTSGGIITVTAIKNGNATIKATAGDKENTCIIKVDTKVTNIDFDPKSLSLSLKDSESKKGEIKATIEPSTATIQDIYWSIKSGTGIVKIDSDQPIQSGNKVSITALKNGTAVLTAKAGTSADAYSKDFNVTVDTTLEGLTISKTEINDLDLESKKTETIYGTINPSTASEHTITWSITDSKPEAGYEKVIELSNPTSEPGEANPITITAIGNGKATISASVNGKFTQTCSVTIQTFVNKIDFDPSTLSLDLNEGTNIGTIKASVNKTAYNKKIDWSIKSGSENIISINKSQTESGESVTVTAKANGDGYLTVSSNDGKVSKEYKVTVATAVSNLKLSSSTMNLDLNEGTKASTINGVIEPVGARDQDISWTLVDPGDTPIVSLSKNKSKSGEDITVTANGNGEIDLKASVGGKEQTCHIVVDTAVTSIEISKTEMSLDLSSKPSDTIYATISPSYSSTTKVKWRVTSGTDIVSVSPEETSSGATGEATVTALKNGTAKIEAYTGSGSSEVKSSECVVKVDTVITKLEISAEKMDLVNNNTSKNTSTINATITPAEATLDTITWTLSDTGIVSLSSTTSKTGVNITVTALAKGTVTLTATVGTFTKTCSITVTTDVKTITCESKLELCVGGETTTSSLNVVVLPAEASDKSYTITSGDTSIASIEDEKIKALKTGTVVLTVKSVSNEEVTNTCTLTITNPKLNWTGTQSGLGNKSPKTIASSSNKVIFGKKSDYESEIEGLTGTQVGERTCDEIYAYVKDSGTSSQILYILSDGIIRFDNNDTVGMFQTMDILGGLTFANIDTSGVTDMSYMFGGASSGYDPTRFGDKLDLTAFDTSNVTNLSSTFWRFETKTLDLSTWDTSKVTNMSDLFFYSHAKTVYVSDLFVTTSVTSSYRIFQECDLTGQLGTKADSSHYNDKNYARIDKEGEPGVFWAKS